jgi:hypothetical protein
MLEQTSCTEGYPFGPPGLVMKIAGKVFANLYVGGRTYHTPRQIRLTSRFAARAAAGPLVIIRPSLRT